MWQGAKKSQGVGETTPDMDLAIGGIEVSEQNKKGKEPKQWMERRGEVGKMGGNGMELPKRHKQGGEVRNDEITKGTPNSRNKKS